MLFYYSYVMFSFLPLTILYFPCYVQVSLDFKLELILKKFSKFPKNFSKHVVSDGQWEVILKHKCTFAWCSYHFKSKLLCQKEKQFSVTPHDFFCVYVRWTYISRSSWFIKVERHDHRYDQCYFFRDIFCSL